MANRMSREEARRRLEELQAEAEISKSAKRTQDDPTVARPKGLETEQKPTSDRIQARIDAYYQKEISIKGIHSKFKSVPELSQNLKPAVNDFRDDELIGEPGYDIAIWDDEKVAELGRQVIPMLSSGFSPRGAAGIFYLAHQLRHPSSLSKNLFRDSDYPSVEEDLSLLDMSENKMIKSVPCENLRATTDLTTEAAAYAFVAASTLRLYTKSEDNYIKAFNHILLGYERFYGMKLSITIPSPTKDGLRSLTHQFQHNDRMKISLYRTLYAGQIGVGEGIRNFLYEMHLTNTGLHIIGIFSRLCLRLNCPTGLLLTAINNIEWARQTTALGNLLNLVSSGSPEHKKKMWRFGRIFNDAFMSPLQTKACPVLTYILAYALKSEAAKTNAHILNIVQLEDVSPDKRRLCEDAADRLVASIRERSDSIRHGDGVYDSMINKQ